MTTSGQDQPSGEKPADDAGCAEETRATEEIRSVDVTRSADENGAPDAPTAVVPSWAATAALPPTVADDAPATVHVTRADPAGDMPAGEARTGNGGPEQNLPPHAPSGPVAPSGPAAPSDPPSGPAAPMGPAEPPPDESGPPPGWAPNPGGHGPRPLRLLRRSRSNRMGVGLCGGLGDYFGVDPVLFRVLIVVLSIFGGAGIVLYLAGWLIVPEEGTETSSLDRAVADLRRRRVPFAIAIGVAAVLAWIVAFSWWAPGGLFPAVVVAAVALFILAYRDDNRLRSAVGMPPHPAPAGGTGFRPTPPSAASPNAWAAATASAPSTTATSTVGTPAPPGAAPGGDTVTAADAGSSAHTVPPASSGPTWSPVSADQPTTQFGSAEPPAWPPPQATAPASTTQQLREWRAESRERRAERRRRMFPMRLAVGMALVVDLVALGIADATNGIPFVTYFWSVGAIVLVGLLVGAAVRRTPWASAVLLVPALIGSFAFLGSNASLHDGNGDRQWTPATTSELAPSYRTAFGRSQLDLSDIRSVAGTHHIDVLAGAGQVVLVLPNDIPVRVHADIHAGQIEVDGTELHAGVNYNRNVSTTASTTGGVIDIDVELSNGQLKIDRI